MMMFWIFLYILILVLLFWTNRGFIRSGKAVAKYKKAIMDWNLWLINHPGICPCSNVNGQKLKQAAVDAFTEFVKVPQSTADHGYLEYLKNFHASGCESLK